MYSQERFHVLLLRENNWFLPAVVSRGTGWGVTPRSKVWDAASQFSSASFRGESEGRAKSVPVWSSSRCSFLSLFLEDALLPSFVASHIPRSFVHLKKKKEREKMATSRGVDRHFRGPGQQKWWRKGETSGDATRKCSKGSTVTFNNGWRG